MIIVEIGTFCRRQHKSVHCEKTIQFYLKKSYVCISYVKWLWIGKWVNEAKPDIHLVMAPGLFKKLTDFASLLLGVCKCQVVLWGYRLHSLLLWSQNWFSSVVRLTILEGKKEKNLNQTKRRQNSDHNLRDPSP